MSDTSYKHLEPVFQKINTQYISLPEVEVKRNNIILKEIMDTLAKDMRKTDTLFDNLYDTIYYGGSYYEGLKVGKPEEYDLDLLLRLPKLLQPVLVESDHPGFLYIQLSQWELLSRHLYEYPKYSKLEKLLQNDNNNYYLLQTKIRSWLESVINKTILKYEKSDNQTESIICVILDNWLTKFKISFNGNGPAFTLKIRGFAGDKPVVIDVDLVPAFTFPVKYWPSAYRRNSSNCQDEFFLIPKSPENCSDKTRYWRPSFPSQEKAIMKNISSGTLKPIIRLIKKLRDSKQQNDIASYYIKTIFLYHCNEFTGNLTLSDAFMKGLKFCETMFSNGKIPYYWKEEHNLIGHIDKVTCRNRANCLLRAFNAIERNPTPDTTAKQLLTPTEYEKFKIESIDLVPYNSPYSSYRNHPYYVDESSDSDDEIANIPVRRPTYSNSPTLSTETEESNTLSKILLAGAIGLGVATAIGYGISRYNNNRNNN